MKYLFISDSNPETYDDIDGEIVVIVRQLDESETDDVMWEIVPVMPIKGRKGERWLAMPSELTPYGRPIPRKQ